jgi:chemosensory pili system protein ChpA (sensor histidine kinase/response regulator)
MSTFGKIDSSTLGWVKGEIDETLKQARLALESFAENPADKTRLRFCITHLHQVVGTLTMVELDGAAMLARETEQLAEAVLSDSVPASPATFDTLTRSIVTLPDYLARLQFGQDAPFRYVPLINEMRSARGAVTISELELFTPDLSVRPPPEARAKTPLDDADYRALARNLRPTMQTALLNWLRDAANAESLAQIGAVFDQLRDQAAFAPLEQLFWVAGGFVEALTDGLEATAGRKKLFARLDQQIKRLAENADKSELRKNAETVTRAMLWEVGTSPTAGKWVTQLRQAFGLEALLPGAARAQTFEMPAPEVLASVSSALGTEVTAAQDLLTTYFDPANHDAQVLEQLLGLLEKMASVLDMLGVPPLKQLVDEIAATCRALIERRIASPDASAMPLAEALLALESGAREVTHTPHEWSRTIEDGIHRLRALREQGTPANGGIEVGEAELTETEFKQLLSVVAGEVAANLGRIEEAVESFAADTTRREVMQEVPGLLSQIQGAMQILAQDPAAVLVETTRGHVENILAGTLAPTPAIMDALAVSVGTIGAYMEGLHTERRNLDMLIETAQHELAQALSGGTGAPARPARDLKADLDAWLADPHDHALLGRLRKGLESRAGAAREQGEERFARIAGESERLLQLVAEEPARLTPEVEQTLIESVAALAAASALMAPPPATAPAAPVAPAKPAAAPAPVEPVDEEIREIFIEDARDVLSMMTKYYAIWHTDPENKEAFGELRRGFHTLKGSGRMVNASEIAEFSWAIENMLNRVRDGKLPCTPEVIEIVGAAQEVLPQMVDHYAGGPAPTLDAEPLRLQAQHLVQPGTAARAPVVDAAPAHEDIAADSGPLLPKLDGMLLEIFTNEARGHLDNIEREISASRAEGARLVSEVLFRSTHTLAGNARSLGIHIMSEACHETEKVMQAMRSQALALDEEALGLVERLYIAVSDLVDLLNRGDQRAGDLPARFADIAREARELMPQTQEAPPPAALDMPHPEPRPQTPAAAAPPRPAPAPVPPAPARRAAAPAPPPDVDPELLEIFHEEAGEILGAIDDSLARLRTKADDRGAMADFKRALHTLKGGGRMAGVFAIGDLAHVTEGLLKRIEDGHGSFNAEAFELFHEVHDLLIAMLDRLEQGEALPDTGALYAKIGRIAPDLQLPVTAAPVVEEEIAAAPVLEPEPAAEPAPAPMPAEVVPPPVPVFVEPVRPVVTPAPVIDVPPPAPEVLRPAAEAARPAPEPAREFVHRTPLVAGHPAVTRERAVELTEVAADVPLAEVPDERRELPEDDARGAGAWPEKIERRGQIKVRTALLNELVNYAGEVSISRSRMEQQIHSFRDNMGELSRNVVRFRDQIRELEIQSESQILYRMEQASDGRADVDFDPLEFDRFSRLQQLSRSLAETLHDLSTIQMNLGTFVGEAETVLQQQARLNTELQEGLMRTRMVSFDTIAARLRHIVRTTARELGKNAELDLSGAEVELDRTVLERMIGPFEHMIRNSLDHGIESPEARRAAGKPTAGHISIACAQEGSEIVIRFADDGAGLNIEAIRKKAIERGLLADTASLTDEELIQFILMPGFSTATRVTHLSGRGVGMDVVHNEVKQLGGTMTVDTRRGAGAAFVVRLPLTLSITQALMVHVGEQVFAVPLGSVANIIEFPVDRLKSIAVGKNPLLEWNDQVYPYLHLGNRLGLESIPRNARKVPVLLARAGSREIAMQVDGLSGTREVVIKALGPQLTEIKGLAGATILGDGRVVLILDLAGLWYRDETTLHVVPRRAEAEKPKAPAHERPVIMVVDDSLTVRKVTGKHLQKRGMEVLTAKDGVDAVDQLRDRVPDLMLVDIEMPRMDGYELTQRVRSEERLKHVPIIMITSRAGAKHRQKAFELGVDMYMSKPYQEEELFKNIDGLLARGRAKQ